MRKAVLFVAFAAILALGGCANLKTVYTAVTSSTAPAKSIYLAANGFNSAKALANSYVVYCTPNPTPVGCNDAVIQGDIIPWIGKGTKARDELTTFIKAHPGALGDAGVYQTLLDATSTLQTLLAANDKR